ncbi:MAG: transglutaminase family protein [Verrucomicrobiae bacterium]|nr:transglutaminase family protein [Verrucomicrobiae bacterium]
MRLKILHRTRYRYSQPVSENYNEVRLQPVSDEGQECHGYRLVTEPVAKVERYHDFHFNLVDHFYLKEPHGELVLESCSEVTTRARAADSEVPWFPVARLGECQRLERCYDFLQPSEYVSLGVEVWRVGQDLVSGVDDAWQLALRIMGHIHETFVYEAGSTTVSTTMEEALRERRGVCQDFAHVMLGLCRSTGIPARYVSGYLHVPAGTALRGDLASHAWVEVYLPRHGWMGLDPTNNRMADEHHVKVAVGRDYADAAPVRGNFKGRAEQTMTAEVRIEPVKGVED